MSSLTRASTFRHAPINPERDTIRLIRLKKGPVTATISCELFETSLGEDRGFPYEALSYTWGGSEPGQSFLDHDGEARCAQIEKPVTIVVNHFNFYVAPNLYSALCHLRDVETDRILWVDAICIDQDNDREKGHQVGMMRRIFEQAKGVAVWLGEGNAKTDFFMDVVAEVWAVWQQQTTLAKTALERLQCRRRRDGLRFDEASLAASLREILDRPWFTRVWVIQEVASANTGVVICGAKSNPSDAFASVTTFLLDQEPIRNALELLPGALQTRKALLVVMPGPHRAGSWWTKDRTLGNLLAKFHDSQASNPRDNTYALLGISSDACDPTTFPPDYTKTVHQVIRDTAAFLIFRSLDSPAAFLANLFGPQALRLLYRRGTLQYRTLERAMGTGCAEVVRVILRSEIFGLSDEAMNIFMVRYVEFTGAGAHYDTDRGHGDPRLNSMLLSLASKTGEEFSVRKFVGMGMSPFEANEMAVFKDEGQRAILTD